MTAAVRKYPFVPDGVTVRSVSQLTDDVRRLLEGGFATVWVEGEISNLSRPNSGHIYLTLKDAGAALRAVLFRTQALRLPAGFEPRDGVEVVACGRVSVYAPRGDYQFMIDRLFPKGVGAAELAFRQLKEKLFRLGYFDPKRKKPLPRFPRSVCLIVSATGAAVRDLLTVMGRRWPATKIAVRPSRVQGEGAAEEIAAAVRQVNAWKARGLVQVDVIIIGRGGGSAEDLAAYNTEVVAQAIYDSRIPVVSAVGHEVDVSLADLVADVRAATPSHAAELVVPDRLELTDTVRDLGDRLLDATRRRCQFERRRLDNLAARRVLREPLDRLRMLERELDDWDERLRRAAGLALERARRSLEAASARLETLSPLNVLARGYSLTRAEARPGLIRAADQVQPGDRIVTVVERGQIVSRVESTDADPQGARP